jgi:hypothetical protein
MASGDAVVQVLEIIPPGANGALFDFRVGGSTPPEAVPVYDFPANAYAYLDFKCRLSGYDGNGLTLATPWSASSATSGQVRWGAAIRRIADDAEDIDNSHTYDYNEVSDTAPSASGEVSYPTITFADGVDMDNWDDGELAIVRVYRHYDHADDNMSGDAELWNLSGIES